MQKKKRKNEKVPSIARFARTFILHVFSYVPYLYLSIYVYVCYHLLACVFSNCMFCFFSHFSSISIIPCRLMLYHPSPVLSIQLSRSSFCSPVFDHTLACSTRCLLRYDFSFYQLSLSLSLSICLSLSLYFFLSLSLFLLYPVSLFDSVALLSSLFFSCTYLSICVSVSVVLGPCGYVRPTLSSDKP